MDKHLCNTCRNEQPTCEARNIVWGIDLDPPARGADADKVLECDAYAVKSEAVDSPAEVNE